VKDPAVVGDADDERIPFEPEFAQRFQHIADAMIRVRHHAVIVAPRLGDAAFLVILEPFRFG
jgi:hypothetical protein